MTEKKAFLFVLAGLGIFFVMLLRPVLIPLFLALILTILFYPIYHYLLELFRNRRYLASLVTTFSIFLIFVLPSGMVVALVVDQAYDFVEQMNLKEALSFLVSQDFYQAYLEPLLGVLRERLHVSIDVAGLLSRLGGETARYIYNFSPQVLFNTATFIFGFFVMHISIFFLFIEGKDLFSNMVDLSPLRRGHEKKLTSVFKNMIDATVYGYLLTALIQGILAGVGFWLAGVKAPVLFGALTSLMSLVPIVGATSVWLPMALWYLIGGHVGWGVFIVLYGAVVVSGVDNILKPLIMRGKAKIHILLIFFSLLGGITLFGPVGILFGPVITAMFIACIRIYREDFLTAKVS